MGWRELHKTPVGIALLLALALPSSAVAFPISDGSEFGGQWGQFGYTTGHDPSDTMFFGGRDTAPDSLLAPTDVFFDDNRNVLYIADTLNRRVLRFNNIVQGSSIGGEIPEQVLFQEDFFTGGGQREAPYGASDSPIGSVNARGVKRPWSLDMDVDNNILFVADPDNRRVLLFDMNNATSNGPAAIGVIGQPSMTSDSLLVQCGGASAGTADACGIGKPFDIAWDSSRNVLWVADATYARVLGYDLSGGYAVTHPPASYVLGQPDFTSTAHNMACDGLSSGQVNACGFYGPEEITYDEFNDRLYVWDYQNYRILGFDLDGAQPGTLPAASIVIGQPDFESNQPNTSCDGTIFGAENTNACGLGIWGGHLDVNAERGQLWVSDTANSRVLVWDVSAIAQGPAGPAMNVIGQADFAAGYNPLDSNYGGGVSQRQMVLPMGLHFDNTGSRVFVADTGNHRLVILGPTVGGEAITIIGDAENTSVVETENGVEVTITTADGVVFTVELPYGTTGGTTGDILLEVDNDYNNGSGMVGLIVNARLPAGSTKTITVTKTTNYVCLIDAEVDASVVNTNCPAWARYDLPNPGTCETHTLEEGGVDEHDIDVCLSADGELVTVSGLWHSFMATEPMANAEPLPGAGCKSDNRSALLWLLTLVSLLSLRKRFANSL